MKGTPVESIVEAIAAATAGVQRIRGEHEADAWRDDFAALAAMPGSSAKLRRIAGASTAATLGDYLAEVQYALLFQRAGLDVQVEPKGSAGPDLAVCDGAITACVEVRRLRRVNVGPQLIGATDTPVLHVYGNPARDVRKAYCKLQGKFPQTTGSYGIIAVWNSDDEIEEIEIQVAAQQLAADVAAGCLAPPVPNLLVLSASSWVCARSGQQVHCFKVSIVDARFAEWAERFCRARVPVRPGVNA